MLRGGRRRQTSCRYNSTFDHTCAATAGCKQWDSCAPVFLAVGVWHQKRSGQLRINSKGVLLTRCLLDSIWGHCRMCTFVRRAWRLRCHLRPMGTAQKLQSKYHNRRSQLQMEYGAVSIWHGRLSPQGVLSPFWYANGLGPASAAQLLAGGLWVWCTVSFVSLLWAVDWRRPSRLCARPRLRSNHASVTMYVWLLG